MATRALITLLALVGTLTGHARAADRPNIVLIMADDFGYECVGANGGESYQTPHLDRLASTGMQFDQCYVQPLCTPTRVELMTGLSNARNYIQFARIDRDATTFAHLLKDAGYATAIAGKWQLGGGKRLPQRLGFEEACLWQHTRRPPRYANPGLEYNGQERDFTGGEYGPDLVQEFALDFITRHKEGPFLLYYPMMLTHVPYQPTPDSSDWNPETRGEQAAKDVKHFADMVKYMDKLVGGVVAHLEELGVRDNTLVLFLGDNGTGREIVSQFKGHSYPGGKGLTNAGGTHVPLIANWPARTKPGRTSGDLVRSTDFLATLCEAAGVELPSSMPRDGQSFFPQLVGEPATPRAWFYAWYSKNGGMKNAVEFAMTHDAKLYGDGRFYDLKADPFEEHALPATGRTIEQITTAQVLQQAIDQYADARPAELRNRPDKPPQAAKGGPDKGKRKAARAARRASA